MSDIKPILDHWANIPNPMAEMFSNWYHETVVDNVIGLMACPDNWEVDSMNSYRPRAMHACGLYVLERSDQWWRPIHITTPHGYHTVPWLDRGRVRAAWRKLYELKQAIEVAAHPANVFGTPHGKM
jgi:hypothetical protein